jgi:uncharacterized protein (TIGR02145 family)
MYRLTWILLLMAWAAKISAQEFYISFQPKEEGTLIDSVWVTNLITGQKVKLLGEESLLLTQSVTSTIPTGINQEVGYIYPNPSGEHAALVFPIAENGPVNILVYNSTGQPVMAFNQQLISGIHRFNIRFPSEGMFFISVLKNSGPVGLTAVSTGKARGSGEIIYDGWGSHSQVFSETTTKSLLAGKSMTYHEGDILHYSGFSAGNNTFLTDSPLETKVYTLEFVNCLDFEKNSYPAVKIGTQWWMAGNLKTTHYADGSDIPNLTANTAWAGATSGAYCWYDNDGKNKNPFGALYNWFAVADSRKICPAGWHVPTDGEWTTLENYLIANGHNFDGTGNGNKIAKSLAATTLWDASTTRGAIGNKDFPASRNKSGFTAYPAGGRAQNGAFDIMGIFGLFWTSTEKSSTEAWARYLFNDDVTLDRWPDLKKLGYSVRCVKDN